jgi:uncharacterized protein
MSDVLVIWQLSGFCNIDCTYCYLPSRNVATRVSKPIVDKTIGWIANNLGERKIDLCFHGGEPLAVNISEYEYVFERLRAEMPSANIQYKIQSNGILINERWCEFFLKHHVSVGLSLDGPAHLNDINRMTRGGAGTFSAAMRGIELFKKYKIPLNFICVVSEHSLSAGAEVIRFFEELGANSVAFNIPEIENSVTSSWISADDAISRYRNFLLECLNCARTLEIREISAAVQKVRSDPEYAWKDHQNVPFGIVGFGADGDIYTYSPEFIGVEYRDRGRFSIGNVAEDKTISDIANSPRFLKILNEIEEGKNNCRNECEYYRVCGGGPPVNKLSEKGSFLATETQYCKLQVITPINAVIDTLINNHGPNLV